MPFAEEELTTDAFLGGRLSIRQPRHGYRAATDPVFLAAACGARSGDGVLELGCGVGVASLCLAARVPGLRITGIERQADYADLARRNAATAGTDLTVVAADLADLPAPLRQKGFDHVIANPPYHAAADGTAARDAGREAALREFTPLADWIVAAHRRLVPRGWLTVIQAADRLPDLLAAFGAGFGSVTVLPLAGRSGRPAGRVIVRARKGGRAPFALLPPFVVHSGARHGSDGDDHTAKATAILRGGAALDWGDRANWA